MQINLFAEETQLERLSKLVTDYAVTPANVHDSNEFEDFVDEKDEAIYRQI